MSRETRTNYSKKKKMNGEIIQTVLPKETAELVNQVYEKFGARAKEQSNTLRALMYVALKNNFDNNLNYIPCQERRPSPQMIADKNSRGKSITTSISCSPNLLAKIDKLVEINHSNRCAIMRMLVCISLQYNYDKDLNYKPAERISYEYQAKQYESNVVILLDEI